MKNLAMQREKMIFPINIPEKEKRKIIFDQNTKLIWELEIFRIASNQIMLLKLSQSVKGHFVTWT